MRLQLAGGAVTLARLARWFARRAGWHVAPLRAEARTVWLLDDPTRWYTRAGGCLTWEHTAGGAWLTLAALAPRGDAVGTWSRVTQRDRRSVSVWTGLRSLPAGAVQRHCEACGGPLRVRPLGALQGTDQVVRVRHRGGAELELRWTCLRPLARAGGRLAAARGRVSITVLAEPGAALAELHDVLQQFPLAPADGSSPEQSLALVGCPAPVLPPPVVLRAAQTLASAWRLILTREVALWDASEAGVRLGVEAEHLHDLRVAVRRLRVAVRLLTTVLPPGAARRLGTELAWLARALAAVRDLDVQGNLLARQLPLLSATAVSSLPALQAAWWAERTVARRSLLAALNTTRYGRLRRRLGALAVGAPVAGPEAAAPLGALAGRWLWKLGRKLQARAVAALAERQADQLHELRITTRRLRYAGEWLDGLYGPRWGEYTRAAVRLQSVLGRHHDAVVSVAWLKAQGGQRGSRTAVRELLALRRATMRAAEGDLEVAWERVAAHMVSRRYLRTPRWTMTRQRM